MVLKSILFVSILVAAMAASNVEAQIGGNQLAVVFISGTVFCTTNGTRGSGLFRPPAFRNADVQLQCGAGNVEGTDRTNILGNFVITVGPRRLNITAVSSNCSLVVTTPLARCNSTLPSNGTLRSSLQLVTSIGNIIRIVRYVPTGFGYVAP